MRKIKFNNASNYYYDGDGYNGFSLVSKKNHEIFEPDPCKESFVEMYWDYVQQAHTSKKIILFKNEYVDKKWATQAQNLLNIVEKQLKTPLSKVAYHCEIFEPEDDYGDNEKEKYHRLIIDVHSPLWFKNGPMLHLFCLLVRNADAIAANRKGWKTILRTLQKSSGDSSQFTVARNAIPSLIKHRGELVLGRNHTHLGICDYANEDFAYN